MVRIYSAELGTAHLCRAVGAVAYPELKDLEQGAFFSVFQKAFARFGASLQAAWIILV